MIIQIKFLVDIQFICIDIFQAPRPFTKVSKLEMSIIIIHNHKLGSVGILFDIFGFDVINIRSTDLLLKSQSITFKTVLFDIIFSVCSFGDG